MKIVTIGGSGFVGTRLIDLLLRENETIGSERYEIKNVDLQESHFFNELTERGDVRVQEEMDEAVKGADVVVLLAAQHRDDVRPVDEYYRTNVGGWR